MDAATEMDGGAVSSAWATGGTAAMVASASYPDPFAAGVGSTCELQCTITIGPCHTVSAERADISDGWDASRCGLR